MQDICLSVNVAIEKGCYLAALALALTIPDIYGAVEYPHLSDEGFTQKRYVKWFDKNVRDYHETIRAINGIEKGPHPKYPAMDGYICYKLRCKVMHCGGADIGVPDLDFSLIIHEGSQDNPSDSTGIWTRPWDDKKIKKLGIDVVHLCGALSKAGQAYVGAVMKEGDADKLQRLKATRLEVTDLDSFSQFCSR